MSYLPMPIDDWQFWLVTILALVALWMLLRPFVPRKNASGGGGGCTHCASGAAAMRKRRNPSAKKVPLTIGGAASR